MKIQDFDYELISTKLNEDAKNILLFIKKHNYCSIYDQYKNLIDTLLNKKEVIIVEKPTKENEELFNGDVPKAHGGRTKEDGLIHIYPYRFNVTTTEGFLESINNSDMILHEIFHYFIQLDLKEENKNSLEIELGHFLTEGMVQLYTEETYPKIYNKLAKSKSGYRKNVILAQKLRIDIEQNLGNPDIHIISSNYLELLTKIGKRNEYINEYEFIIRLEEEINQILLEAEEHRILEPLKTTAKKQKGRYKSLSIEEELNNLENSINLYYPNIEIKLNHINRVHKLKESLELFMNLDSSEPEYTIQVGKETPQEDLVIKK